MQPFGSLQIILLIYANCRRIKTEYIVQKNITHERNVKTSKMLMRQENLESNPSFLITKKSLLLITFSSLARKTKIRAIVGSLIILRDQGYLQKP